MKKLLAVASFILILSMAFGTMKVYADSGAAVPEGRKGPNPNSQSQDDRRATQQAEKDQRVLTREADKAERMGDNLAGKKVHFRGVVTAVDAASLTIKLSGGEEIVFTLTDKTVFKIPTLGPDATWEKLNPGVTVLVQAVKPKEAGTETETAVASETAAGEQVASATPTVSGLTAVKVLVVPGKPARIHRVGEVTAYEAGKSITIKARDGNEYTFALTDKTKILPDDRVDKLVVGAVVTIISPRDVTGGPLTAMGIVVHDTEEKSSETVVETPTP